MKVVLNTFGSFGDLHPYLAIAIELRRRGYQPVVATAEVYRAKVEAEGVGFSPVRPNIGELLERPDLVEKIWDPVRGSEFLLRDYIMPEVEHSYDDLSAACENADLIVTHVAACAGPILAEKLKLPWISVALQPAVFFSTHDPPVLAPAKWLRHARLFGRWPFHLLFALARHRLTSWVEPIARLRRRLGLPPVEANPLMKGQFSPIGTLALFSEHFTQRQPDWPPNVHITGFAFYDKRGKGFGVIPEGAEDDGLDPELAKFLENGSPPVLFTLGSSAVMQAGDFYLESLAAVKTLGVRAVLLVGIRERQQLPRDLPESVHIAEYAPYSELMPRVAVTVHQGGIGTTAQALRAGHPTLIVPWAHDQPDNAERARRLGVSRTVDRSKYTSDRIARELSRLLNDSIMQSRAAALGARIAAEDGVNTACDAISEIVAGNRARQAV